MSYRIQVCLSPHDDLAALLGRIMEEMESSSVGPGEALRGLGEPLQQVVALVLEELGRGVPGMPLTVTLTADAGALQAELMVDPGGSLPEADDPRLASRGFEGGRRETGDDGRIRLTLRRALPTA